MDGDADRVVYYFVDQDNTFHLLDGDKIASLAATFLSDITKAAGLTDVKVGVVQTAYANGSSTAFIEKSLRLPVSCTATGVKHLHHEAASKFDIGVYFEANGHGTVLFNTNCLWLIESGHKPKNPAEQFALAYLRSLTELINQAVGDALSDLLFVEVVLAHKGWSVKEWSGLYTDLPNRLVRVEVPDRRIFTTTDAERRLVSPQGVQETIDAWVGKYKQGRAFARASGTEDAVRVYAEVITRLGLNKNHLLTKLGCHKGRSRQSCLQDCRSRLPRPISIPSSRGIVSASIPFVKSTSFRRKRIITALYLTDFFL